MRRLYSKRIFAAALDVTVPEPLPADHPLLTVGKLPDRAAHCQRQLADTCAHVNDGGRKPHRRAEGGEIAKLRQPGSV